MNPPARRWELTDALEFESEELQCYFDRQTGRVVMVERSIMAALDSRSDEELEEQVESQDEEVELARAIRADEGKDERFIAPPDKFEFHEYRQMERFIGTIEDAAVADQLWIAIKGKGAFRYFRDTLRRLRLEDRWYRFREQATKEFVLRWAEDNEVTVVEGPRTPDE